MWPFFQTEENPAFLAEVKRARKKLRIPQKVIAHELGMTQAAYSKIESGSSPIKFQTGIFLIKRLNLNPENYLIP